MKISLLVPLFNSSRYLDRLKARQLITRRVPFDEVVMHDDGGSTDDTIEKAAGLGFRVIRGGPMKRQSHRSKPIACGRIIQLRAFPRSDRSDSSPTSSSACVTACSSNGSRDVSFRERPPPSRRIISVTTSRTTADLVFNNFVHLNAMVVSQRPRASVSGFDENLTFCEEKDFLFKILQTRSACDNRAGASCRVEDPKFIVYVQPRLDWCRLNAAEVYPKLPS